MVESRDTERFGLGERVMANRELQEWLGLTLPDLLVYLGSGAVRPGS